MLAYIAGQRDEYFIFMYHQAILLEHNPGGERINI